MAACFAPSSETYFIPVACFLLFNMMDWAGRSLTAVCMWVSNSSFLNKCLFPASVRTQMRSSAGSLTKLQSHDVQMPKSGSRNNARLPVVFLEFFLAKVKGFKVLSSTHTSDPALYVYLNAALWKSLTNSIQLLQEHVSLFPVSHETGDPVQPAARHLQDGRSVSS